MALCYQALAYLSFCSAFSPPCQGLDATPPQSYSWLWPPLAVAFPDSSSCPHQEWKAQEPAVARLVKG